MINQDFLAVRNNPELSTSENAYEIYKKYEEFLNQDLFIDTLRKLGIKTFVLNNSDPDIIDSFKKKGCNVTLVEFENKLWISV